MDFQRLSAGERSFAIAGSVLVVSSFIPLWATFRIGPESHGTSAWAGVFPFYTRPALLLATCGLVLVIAAAADRGVGLPVSPGHLYAWIGGLVTLLLLAAALDGPRAPGFRTFGIEIGRGPVLVVAPLIAATMAFGGLLHRRAEASGARGSPSETPGPPPSGAGGR